jgi:hypothetical protein
MKLALTNINEVLYIIYIKLGAWGNCIAFSG